MSEIFIAVLNMSLTASYVAVAVTLARLLLRKAPKIFSYALWAVVLFRMICPFSFESVLSLLPANPEPIPQDIVTQTVPRIDSGITFVDTAVNRTIQNVVPPVEPVASISPMQIVVTVGACIWLSGIVILIAYAIISYIRTKRRIFDATLVRDNIFQTDRIQTPFVIGFIRPKIYIPVGLDEKETDYIIMHERTHIRRGDHIIKVLAFMALAVHWFNPLMWVSYFLMSKDMEMSCDERVMKLSGEDIRTKYSQSLLSLSVKQSGLPNPLAFGESNVKTRVKNVLNFKKHPRLIIALAAILALTVIVGCAMNRANPNGQNIENDEAKTNGEYDIVKLSGIDENDFNDYLHKFITISYISQKDDITLERVSLLVTYYADILETSLGHTFETAGDDGRYTQTQERTDITMYYGPRGSTNLLPKEVVSKVASALFDIDFGSQDFAESFYVTDNEGILPYHAYLAAPEAFSGAYVDYDILKDTFSYEDGVISVQVQFYEFDTNKTIKEGKRQYKFNTVLYENEIICYQLNDIYVIDSGDDIFYERNMIDFNISIQPAQYNENPFYDDNTRTIINSVEELKALCKDETYAYTVMTGTGTEGMYLSDLSQFYNAEYFQAHTLAAVSFEYSPPNSIPKAIYMTREENILTAWVYSFEDMSLPENENFASGLYTARVFLVEVKKADIEGVTEVRTGIDGAPVIIDGMPGILEPPFNTENPTDFDGDGRNDEILFEQEVSDKSSYGAYPKLTVNFADGKTAVKEFILDGIDYFLPGRYAVADIDGDGQPEIVAELQNMGSFANYYIAVLKYDTAANSFIELSTIYFPYKFDVKMTDNYQYTISCAETGFASETYRVSDEWVIAAFYNENGALKNSNSMLGGVDGIEQFYTVQTEYGTGIEIHQYAWETYHANNIGYAISVLVWKNGEFEVLSQRFAPYKAPVPVFSDGNPSDLAPVTEDTPPPPAPFVETAPARPVGLEEEIYRFISYHHYYNSFMNNDELKPEVNTLYAIWQTYLLETAIGETFEADEKNYGWKIPAETVKNTVSYLYNLDGSDVQYDDFYINKDDSDYFWLPDGFSPDTVWKSIQWDTLTVDNSVLNFDVIFYDSPTDDSDRGEELRTFNYQFEQKLYKDSSPSKTVCYKFISATRVK